jgi:single-strand selective monofunctional uracil DNA glycosylase
MAQTGVPFGDPELVRDWIGIDGPVDRPPREHPKVPIRGFASHRREGSGRRFWGWARDHAGTAEAFFRRCFVWNYCPLCFLGESGANVTPERLCAGDKGELCAICDEGLAKLCRILEPRAVVGIGNFAERRLRDVLGEGGVPIHKLLHPSPANPRANAGWSEEAERVLVPLGV